MNQGKTSVTPNGDRERVLKEVRAAFEREPLVNLHRYPVKMEFADGGLTLEGEVELIATKKWSMELAIAVHGVSEIVDRLRVVPSTRMGDGAILDAVMDALLQEPTLMNCSIQVMRKGEVEQFELLRLSPMASFECRSGTVSFCSMPT